MTRRKKILISSSILVALYVAAYLPLSLLGDYQFDETGKLRWRDELGGLSFSDVIQWQPRFAWCRIFRHYDGTTVLQANFLGYVFAPLILLDQRAVHRTKPVFDEQGNIIQYGKKG
jgi:hypothetical protein